jgi:uncharacterized repeat protein (TIGR04138 family)
MSKRNPDEVIDQIVTKDPRYPREGYQFVREAVDYTQKAISKANKGKTRHITGQELLAGIRAFALQQYGPMVATLFEEWGIRRCEDFGEIVFNLVENDVLKKTETDSRMDFREGYDFNEAFRKPFLPARPSAPPPPEPRSAPA